MLKEKIEEILSGCRSVIEKAKTVLELYEAKVSYLGKSGALTALLKELKTAPPEERPTIGKALNDARVSLEALFAEREKVLAMKEREERIKAETLDVTLSKPERETGALNPATLVINEISSIFIGLGFTIVDGPEIELADNNFTKLNIPRDHPSRDMTDTFYISDEALLRTQTSTMQVRTMEKTKPPIRIICPGKVYRPDDDASHSPMFRQIEGLVVDKGVTLADLKGALDVFARSFFSPETKTRFRPSHFPFTEPSVEVDLTCPVCRGAGCRLCKGTGWIELMGAGVVNPAVLDMCGIDSGIYSGYAFGIGVERAAMVKFGIGDMRLLFDNDIRYLRQFR
jgi:phenylalanyl-tRNA synthetase, alpha subunit